MSEPSPPPDPYDLANRLSEAEAKLRGVEKGLRALFHRVNVNRPGDPAAVQEAILTALAEVLGGLERVKYHPPPAIRPPGTSTFVTLAVEGELPAVGPEGRGVQLAVRLEDPSGVREERHFLPKARPPAAAGAPSRPPEDPDPTPPLGPRRL